jgi:hypothetical protein
MNQRGDTTMPKEFPEWAVPFTREDIPEGADAFSLDPDVLYPLWLEKLRYPVDASTQEQLECARLCATEYLHRIAKINHFGAEAFAFGDVPPDMTVPLFVKILAGEKKWALKNFPEGEKIDANVQYSRLRREKKVDL